jgi:hypothetical protein
MAQNVCTVTATDRTDQHATVKGKGRGKGPAPPDAATLAKGKGKGLAPMSHHSLGSNAASSVPVPPDEFPQFISPPSSKKVGSGPPINVSVMFLDGRCESVQVLASDTVQILKEKLGELLEYSAYRQTLIFNGVILRSVAILADVGVVDGSVLTVCIKTPNPLNVDHDVASVRANVFDELTRRVAQRT